MDSPSERNGAGELSGYRVLVVEDDYFVAQELVSALESNGALVLGPVSGSDDARALARDLAPDCVLLDVNLCGEPAFELAGELRSLGISTVLTTGYDKDFILPRMPGALYLQKPLDLAAVVGCIRASPPRSSH